MKRRIATHAATALVRVSLSLMSVAERLARWTRSTEPKPAQRAPTMPIGWSRGGDA